MISILIVMAGILLLLLLIAGAKLNAFLSLILVSILVGLAEGMEITAVVESVQNGIGSTLGYLVLILGFGAMLGKLVGDSGAAQRITGFLIDQFGKKYVQWALVITGFIVGIPMFYSAGFVILIPLVFTVAQTTGLPLLYVGIPMIASLSVTHGFLPPHPGPTTLVKMFGADFGQTLIYGMILAIPAILLAGVVLGNFLSRIRNVPIPKLFVSEPLPESELPGIGISLFTALFPVVLILADTISGWFISAESMAGKILGFLGDPVIALFLSVLVAIFTLGRWRGKSMPNIMDSIRESIGGIAMILLIISGGGAFKQVLIDSGVGDYIAEQLKDSSLSPLFLAWIIAAALRVSLGSATVAAITAGGIVLPLISATGISPELMVLATGAGSLTLSHVNDTGFWMFKEYFNLDVWQTLSSWTVMETIVSLVGLAGVFVMQIWVG